MNTPWWMWATLGAGLAVMTGCPQQEDLPQPHVTPVGTPTHEGPLEKAGRKLDELGRQAGQGLEDLGDEIEEQTDKLGNDDDQPARSVAAPSGDASTGPAREVADSDAPKRLPAFSLPDPLDKTFDIQQVVREGGAVLVVTAATKAQGDVQSAWSDHLLASMPRGGPRLILLEDLGPSWFPDTAVGRMQEEYDPNQPPLLLIDRQSEGRKALGVEEDTTVVLVYSSDLALVHVDRGEPSRERAEKAWKALSNGGGNGGGTK